MNLEEIAFWAAKKGINLVATGDWTHPLWFREIKANLKEVFPGLFTFKNKPKTQKKEVFFLLSTEISSIYTQGGRQRRIHNLVFSPSFETCEKIIKQLEKHGANLIADGRPIIGLSAKELTELVLGVDKNCLVIPAHCLLGDENLHVNKKIKAIKEVKEGDWVYTHNNHWQRVKKVLTRSFKGKIYQVIPEYFRIGIRVTGEHPFWAIKTKKNCRLISQTLGVCKPLCSQKESCARRYFEDYKPEWIQARDLKKGDVLVFPRFTDVEDINSIKLSNIIDNFAFEKNGQISPGGGRRHKIPNKIKVNQEFCRLAGYYLAEGYTTRDLVSFCFSRKEKDYIEEVKDIVRKIFRIEKFREYQRRGCQSIELTFYSKVLHQVFKHLFYTNPKDRRAYNKCLPAFMLKLPPIKQKEILIGWWRGDKGYTTSRLLMNQMKIICLRLGIIPSIGKDSKEDHQARGNHEISEGRLIEATHGTYHFSNLSFFEDSFNLLEARVFKKFRTKIKRRRGWIDQDYIYLPIRKIKNFDYQGKVYNLEVEEDNSYTAEFACVHNCWTPWYSMFGSKSGFDSIKECFGKMSRYIYGIETGLSCYDEKTELLTENGWKKFTEVRYSDRICTLNPNTDEIEYQKPTRIFNYQYKGKMYKLKTKRVDLLVTPNHNLLVSDGDFRNPPKFLLKEARVLFNKSKRFKKNGIWRGKDTKYFTLPAVKIRHGSRYYRGYRNKKEKKFPMKSWLRFFGFWLADGWTSQGKDGDYNVCLSNQNQKLLSEMKRILRGFGYKVYHYQKANIIRVRDYQLFCYLKQFGKAPDKFIPKDIKSLSKELLEVLFEYYIRGDGHTYGRTGKGLSATTISPRLRDDLQEIALKLGMSAYYRLGYKKGTPLSSPSQERVYKQSEDSWVVYFIRKNIHTVLPSTIKKYNYIESWVDYRGLVYCVAVPNHVIYIRRNGIPVWCGNSDPVMNWRIGELDNRSILSFSDAHSGPKLGREATVFKVQGDQSKLKISYQDIVEAIKQTGEGKLKIGYTIEFFPEEGKYHWSGHRSCNLRYSPQEVKQKGVICPVCHRPLTIGVENRVIDLAERQLTKDDLLFVKSRSGAVLVYDKDKKRKPFVSLIPLLEILIEVNNNSKTRGLAEYQRLTSEFASEFDILLKKSYQEIEAFAGVRLAEAIRIVRERQVFVDPGYDGVFGKVKVFNEDGQEKTNEQQKNLNKQPSLF